MYLFCVSSLKIVSRDYTKRKKFPCDDEGIISDQKTFSCFAVLSSYEKTHKDHESKFWCVVKITLIFCHVFSNGHILRAYLYEQFLEMKWMINA